MDYKTAIKQVNTAKIKDNFMIINLSYDSKLILPYKDGLSFLSSLVNAESFSESYQKPHQIIPFQKSSIDFRIMSSEEYIRYKVAHLLGISVENVLDMEKNPETETT